MVERTTHRAEGVLPTGGLFTTQAMQALPAGLKQLNMLIAYTRGAAGGYPKFEMEWGTAADTASGFSELIRDLSAFVAAGAIGSAPTYIEETYGPPPQSASALKYTLTFVVPYGFTSFRLVAAEQGNTANPGTLTIEFVGGTGEG